MRAVLRLTLWVALYVALLLLVPAVLPPTVNPTFTVPTWSVGDTWRYEVASTLGGSNFVGGTVVANISSIVSVSSILEATFEAGGLGSAGGRWPLTSWTLEMPSGAWSSFTWTCAQGRSVANLSTPVTVGFLFPVYGAEVQNSSSSAKVSGACATGELTVVSSGGVERELAPGGSVACTLYVCNQLRLYPFREELSVRPSATGAPLAAWTLRGTWDPSVSGYRDLSVAPGLGPGFENGSVNATLGSTDAPSDPGSPGGATMYALSALLLLVVPIVAVPVEVRRVRRIAQKEEAEQEREVLEALPPEQREAAEEEGSDRALLEESGPRPPG